jgi:hypothetical protein
MNAYSKHAEVTVPSLDDWEKEWGKFTTQHATKIAAGGFPAAARVTGASELAVVASDILTSCSRTGRQ